METVEQPVGSGDVMVEFEVNSRNNEAGEAEAEQMAFVVILL